MRRKWPGYAAAAMALLAAVSLGRSAGQLDAPAGWERVTRGQPFVSQAVVASGPPPWRSWSLAAYEGFVRNAEGTRLSIDATLPESGSLTLSLSHGAAPSTGLVIEAGAVPFGASIDADGSVSPLTCSGTLDRTPAGPISVSIEQTPSGWTATTGTQTLMCPSTTAVGKPAAIAGLRRVSVESLSVDGAGQTASMLGAVIGAVAAGAGFWAVLLFAARISDGIARAMAVASLSGWSLIHLDGARTVEILRLVDLNGHQLPLTASIVLALLTGSIGLAVRWAQRRPIQWSVGTTTLLFVTIAAIWPVIGAMGWLYTLLGGLSLGGLIWVNVHAHRIRHYNWLALALVGSLVGSIEVMVRYSHVGSLWNAADEHHGTGSMNTLFQQFEGLEAGVHSVYPSGGFPVRLPAKTRPIRIACLGASSTGGAFQNDSLDEFYPARSAQLAPPSVEVVNQGVGGWTSFHVRRFLEGHGDGLQSDVWTVYLGVNEHMPTRMTYADLYDLWSSGGGQARFAGLDNIRLFQALRLLVRGLADSAGAGVPPDHFEENLNAIAALAQSQGVKVLLMNEGIRPDPDALWQYTGVMRAVAKRHPHVEFLDTAAALDRVGDGAFMDSNHLTSLGHDTVARGMIQALSGLNWM
ncbi:MAG: SGNH/GDSL hydrolase family protein [Myxococcota bacterium]|nr:SGNH/GDSL hydrolase family protein [Myxococcota bacterium]